MTVIVFLVDTSASMSQKVDVNGAHKTYLDVAKAAVETFLKYRQRTQECLSDRYMLLTFDEPPYNIKVGWKEPYVTFVQELKFLQSTGLTSMAMALKNTFEMLNLNRMQSGIDTYGQGRCPFNLEPTVIIVLTDGGKYVYQNEIQNDLVLPMRSVIPGANLTKEPFRWDQRVFSLVLRMSGHCTNEPLNEIVPRDESVIEKMCRVTGGRSYKIKTQRVLHQCIENLASKVQSGVMVHLEHYTSNQGVVRCQSFKTMLFVPKQDQSQRDIPAGYWPIPESYWPSPSMANLPPRDAHPRIQVLKMRCDEPQILPYFPVDKYELEPSFFTQQILAIGGTRQVWPVIVAHGMTGLGTPFGYLQADRSFTAVHLFVLPYNYQIFLPLLHDLFEKYKLQPNESWMTMFKNYVNSIPRYYCSYLRNALHAKKIPFDLMRGLLPLSANNYLSPQVATYLKQMQHIAKQFHDNICLRVFTQLNQPKSIHRQSEIVKLNSETELPNFVSHPMLKGLFDTLHAQVINYENFNINIPVHAPKLTTRNYRLPYGIPRKELLAEEVRMRESFYHMPTNELGRKYSTYSSLAKYPPLREVLPTIDWNDSYVSPFRRDDRAFIADHTYSSPAMVSVKNDRAGAQVSSKVLTKRRAGPISKLYSYDRLRKAAFISSENANERVVEQKHSFSAIDTNNQNDLHLNRASIANVQTNPQIIENGKFKNGEVNCARVTQVMNQKATATKKDMEKIEEANIRTRSILYRDIRQPGRNYACLLNHLMLLQGDQATKKKYVNMCLREALRFRRRKMAVCIKRWWSNYRAQANSSVSKRKNHQNRTDNFSRATLDIPQDLDFGSTSDQCSKCWSCNEYVNLQHSCENGNSD